jgi:putative redox protein
MPSNVQLRPTVATFTLSSEGSGVAQTIKVGGSAHQFEVDAAPAFGGHDAAPSPISYGLGALISCSQLTGQIAAKALARTSILVVGTTEGNANFESVAVTARLTTQASDAELLALQAETESRCPIYQLLRVAGSRSRRPGHGPEARPKSISRRLRHGTAAICSIASMTNGWARRSAESAWRDSRPPRWGSRVNRGRRARLLGSGFVRLSALSRNGGSKTSQPAPRSF